MLDKQKKAQRRRKRVRAKIWGSAKIPRLSVFRSVKNIYAQLIDDKNGKTLVSANNAQIKKTKGKDKIWQAKETGKLLAEKALGKKIEKVVFDRGPYKYHGRIKALSEGARDGGLIF